MSEQQQSLSAIHDIRQMMERSSRFISLSGLSGISAGICAIIGAVMAYPYVYGYKDYIINTPANSAGSTDDGYSIILNTYLFWIAICTFGAALLSAFIFTYIKSKKEGIPIWGNSAKRLLVNIAIPLVIGGIFLFKLLQFGTFGLVAPGCLLFYGLALINASKYTLQEVKYLGYGQLLLGITNLAFVGYGLYFWAAGFGILHILYGAYMWWKYDRRTMGQ
jgi:magnesium-transporting ATPase (P-type)